MRAKMGPASLRRPLSFPSPRKATLVPTSAVAAWINVPHAVSGQAFERLNAGELARKKCLCSKLAAVLLRPQRLGDIQPSGQQGRIDTGGETNGEAPYEGRGGNFGIEKR